MRLVDGFDPRFDGPIDIRFSVKNKSELEIMRKSGVSYPFMKVVCEEDGFTYELDKTKSRWNLFTSVGPKGDHGDPWEVGTVKLQTGDLNLSISANEDTGKIDFILTLPDFLTKGSYNELNTTNKTVIGAINELYNLVSNS